MALGAFGGMGGPSGMFVYILTAKSGYDGLFLRRGGDFLAIRGDDSSLSVHHLSQSIDTDEIDMKIYIYIYKYIFIIMNIDTKKYIYIYYVYVYMCILYT